MFSPVTQTHPALCESRRGERGNARTTAEEVFGTRQLREGFRAARRGKDRSNSEGAKSLVTRATRKHLQLQRTGAGPPPLWVSLKRSPHPLPGLVFSLPPLSPLSPLGEHPPSLPGDLGAPPPPLPVSFPSPPPPFPFRRCEVLFFWGEVPAPVRCS